jgi:hypothetical protein
MSGSSTAVLILLWSDPHAVPHFGSNSYSPSTAAFKLSNPDDFTLTTSLVDRQVPFPVNSVFKPNQVCHDSISLLLLEYSKLLSQSLANTPPMIRRSSYDSVVLHSSVLLGVQGHHEAHLVSPGPWQRGTKSHPCPRCRSSSLVSTNEAY